MLDKILADASPYLDENIHPLVLLKILNRDFSNVWVIALADSIFEKIESQILKPINQVVKDKICALKIILNSTRFFDNWVAFEKVVVAFNDRPVDFTMMQFVSVPDIFFVLKIYPEIRNEQLSNEVKSYIYAVCKDNGVYFMPEPMHFINFMHKTPDEQTIMKEQQKYFDNYISQNQLHPKILEQLRAINYAKIKELNRIHEEQIYYV
ncbi:MAG: hypothetical protein QXP66_01810 [Candidatus Aenigmatarchaeota archaeon]